MTNKLFVLFCALFIASCSTTKPPESPSIPQPLPDTSPARGLVVFKAINATDSEAKLIAQAAEKIHSIVGSDCFRDFLLSRKLIQTYGRSNKQVVEHLQSLSGEVPVHMYYKRFSSAVAYRVPPKLDIYLNRRNFYKTLPVCDWASTLAHEGLGHSLGNYTHDFNYNKERQFSVPYSLNSVIEACCK